MIRYRKSSRIRNMIGAFFFAVAMTLLWVETSNAKPQSASMVTIDEATVSGVASIRSIPADSDRL